MILKEKRMNRLFNKSGNITILPVDHGMTLGPIKGIEDLGETIIKLSSNVDSIIMQKGMIKSYYHLLCDRELGLVMHISGNTCLTPNENSKILTGSVEEAVRLGCDGVSIHVNIGNKFDNQMLKDFAEVSNSCDQNGMPLLAMMYARGERIGDELSVDNIKHAARVAQEIGADFVKVNYSGSLDSFKEIVYGCGIPVIMAGGDRLEEDTFLQNVKYSMEAGARGVAVGRNVFQSDNPYELLNNINQIVHKEYN
jgi:predicted phospho-2-dehydro-3-deoxyheptonate aldolase